MHHESPEPLHCACTALRKASRAVTRLYDEALDGTGMSIVQFSILRNVRHGARPLMQLAELLVMDRTTLYRALKPIEQRGWIAIQDGAGRAKTAGLTDKGRQALADATGAWEAVQAKMFDGIGPERWAGIETSLADLVSVATGETR